MIPVVPVSEPPDFDERGRKPGNTWLTTNAQADRPRDFWSPFRHALAEGFHERCGYTAMIDLNGTVDHFRSYKTHPELSYEWSNYRYASGFVNSAKKRAEVLDPYEVGEGWFEVMLPSLQLVATDKVPPEFRQIVAQTLKILPIAHDERVLRQRRAWYEKFQQGKLSLEGLRDVAPLIAAAEEKRRAALDTG